MRNNDAKNRRYRLYDEHLVRNIMMSTAISVIAYVRENPNADSDEICDFIDANADNIMGDTVRQMKGIGDPPAKEEGDDTDEDSGDWLSNEKEQ
jgi:hypothetical protein